MGSSATIVKKLKGDRSEIIKILQDELALNPNFLATWTLWEPNAFDGKDDSFKNSSRYNSQGTLGIAFFKQNDSVYTEIMDQDDYLGDYYKTLETSRAELLTEPYSYQYSGYTHQYFGTTVSVPIVVDEKFLGAVGIDIDLDSLRTTLNKVRPYQTGFLSLITGQGNIVTHIDSSFIDKNIFELFSTFDTVKYSSIINGKEFTIETNSEFTNEKVFRFFYPIRISKNISPWSIMVEIPVENASTRSSQLSRVALGILMVGLLLITFLIFNILDHKRYSKALLEALAEVEHSHEIVDETTQNYQEIFNSTNEAIFIHNSHTGKILDVNIAMLRMYGYSNKEEVKKLTISDLSYNNQNSTEKATEYIKKAITNGSCTFEWQAKKKNGEPFWVEVSLRSSQIKGRGRILAVVRDISERKNSQTIIEQSEKRFRELTELLPLVVWEADLNTKFTYTNKKGLLLFGYTQQDIDNGVCITDILAPESRASGAENIAKLFKGIAYNHEEYTAIKKDGTRFPVEIYSSIIYSENKPVGLRGVTIDFSERKKAEQDLKESQQLFETLAQMSPVGIFRTNADGYTTYVNPKWCELSGLTPQDLKGFDWLNVVHPEDRKTILDSWKQKVKQEEKSVAEYRFLKSDGSVLWVLGSAIPEIVDGVVKGYIGTITDITEFKNAQEKITRSERKFRDMANLLPQIVWEADINGVLTFTNNNALKLLGYNQSDLEKGIDILSLIIPQDRPRAIKNIQEIYNNEKSRGEEFTALRKDGSTYPVQVFTSPIIENNKPIGIRGISIDISEAKKAENKIRESEERYRTIIEAFPDILMIIDLNEKIVFANYVFEKILGITPEDYNTPNCRARIHPDDKVLVNSSIKNLLDGEHARTRIIEFRFLSNEGQSLWFSGIISKLNLNNQVYLQIIARDITERKKIEKELETHRNNLESLVKDRTKELEIALVNLQETQNRLIQSEKMASLGVLAAGIAHEINNPLNFIQGGVSALNSYIQETLPDHTEETEPLIDAIQEGVKRSAAIVKSLNKYSRKDDFPHTLCNPHTIIESCLVMVQNQTKNRIDINKDFCTNGTQISCNEGQIHQAILNILINAIQAIEDKGVIIIKTSTKGQFFLICITDNGCGIEKSNLPRITDPFFTTKAPGQGTGLGLSITYNIISEHNGNLEFESQKGKGTTVTIKLPLN